MHGTVLESVERQQVKLRRRFMSVANCGIRISDIGGITAAKIYKNVVMPRCMYGAGLWCNRSEQKQSIIDNACEPSVERIVVYRGFLVVDYRTRG